MNNFTQQDEQVDRSCMTLAEEAVHGNSALLTSGNTFDSGRPQQQSSNTSNLRSFTKMAVKPQLTYSTDFSTTMRERKISLLESLEEEEKDFQSSGGNNNNQELTMSRHSHLTRQKQPLPSSRTSSADGMLSESQRYQTAPQDDYEQGILLAKKSASLPSKHPD